MVGPKPLQGLVEMPRGGPGVPAIDLGHKEGPVPVPIPQRLAHADLFPPGMVTQLLSRKVIPPSMAVRMIRTLSWSLTSA